MSKLRMLIFSVSVSVLSTSIAMATPKCVDLGYGALPGAKANKLYIYFPPADNATYPSFGTNTSPAKAFNIANLTSYTGTEAALKSGIFDVVTDDYCEFNVEVISTTSVPSGASPTRRNVIAVGTDANGSTWGRAQNVDTGDATAIDYARVWAGTYQSTAGGAGGALNGANSTVERWAKSIGGTTAHEGGHNYGIAHSDGLVLAPGEDVLTHHLMAQGSNYSDEQRASYRRHFSNREYEILAANIGLSVQTMWNWDFVNPNAQTATKLRINFLSLQPSLSVNGPYLGDLSPWGTPVVSAALGTTTVNGVSYNRYTVTWSTPKSWSGGTSGQVAGGGGFHVGTGFSGVDYNLTNPIIITSVDLLDAANTVLDLHPRITGFDDGALDSADGTFALSAFNFNDAPLLISDLQVQFYPRLISIDSLLSKVEKVTDIFGKPMEPIRELQVDLSNTKRVEVYAKRPVKLPLTKLKKGPHFIQKVTEADCKSDDRPDNLSDVQNCRPGMVATLFPSTSTYVTATLTDPNAKYWNPERKAYVVGPLSTKVFYQFVGRRTDLNRNRIDDFVEMASGRARDTNGDGVIDQVQMKRRPNYRIPKIPSGVKKPIIGR
jgi:hypothetical protein